MSDAAPEILVIAGTNGAGKSSVAGDELRRRGGWYYNADEVARRILLNNQAMTQQQANAEAWQRGRHLLEHCIEHRRNYAFETTLGGDSITGLLLKAANVGIRLRVWYVALTTVELHIARVAERVARGGHPIPEDAIRHRYNASRANLIRLIPHLTELRLYDNSVDSVARRRPQPWSITHMRAGVIEQICPLREVPVWARPIVHVMLKVAR